MRASFRPFTVLSAAILSLCLITSAHARLGETPVQIKARYGKPVGGDPNTENYNFKGFQIKVHFVDGKSAQETVRRDPAKGELTMDEVKALLEAYGQGQAWNAPSQRPQVADTTTSFTRGDGSAFAKYTPGATLPIPAGPDTPSGSSIVTSVGTLVIYNQAQLDWEKTNGNTQASDAVKGF